jgi:hypothetical protein
MPNRIIREGILTSPRMARLGWADEVFYRRLMSVVDDFGRYYADEGLLRAHLYPRQLSKVSDSDIGKWLRACVDAALVRVYPAKDGERYLELLDFRQQVRAKESKFPPMSSECLADAAQVRSASEADAPVFVSVFVDESASSAAKPAKAKFEDFYAAYPRKVKPVDARKAWDKLKPDADLLTRMLTAIAEQSKSQQWQKDGGQFIPYPATWLNAGEWDNEAPSAPTAAPAEIWRPEAKLSREEQAAADEVRRRVIPVLKRVSA